LKIIFLDAGTVDWRDASLAPLKKLGNLKVYSCTGPSEVEKRSAGAGIVITNKCVFDRKRLTRLKSLELIALAATGTNNVDLEAASRLGIAVTNVSGYSTESVVQWTFAFLLALVGNLLQFNEAAHNGRWSRSPFFTLPDFSFSEIDGKTLGIVGYGRIGKRVARRARAFGMKVLVARIPGRVYSASEKKGRVSLSELLRRSDFVSLHAPLSSQTEKLINSKAIRQMKRGAFLINMARGGLVEEKALFEALRSGRLAGAAADVLSEEPPSKNHPLLNKKIQNLILTPHIAWASREARARLIREIACNVKAFQEGKRRNRVV